MRRFAVPSIRETDYFSGDYCLMQVFPHPEDPACSILYIHATAPELYQSNFFLRQVIQSSYMNSFHPYYNNAALIFREGKYYGILDYGCPEREL